MILRHLSHRSLLAAVTCLSTVCILVFGMRLPDLSHPSRPKPKPRAYIEQQLKKSQESVAKKSVEQVQVAELPRSCEPAPTAVHGTEYPPAFHGASASPLFPNLSRAPPAFSA